MTEKAHHGYLNSWQLHHLDLTDDELAQLSEEFGEPVLPLVITGSASGDAIRQNGGMRIRTSPLTKYEPGIGEKQGVCETARSVYVLCGQNGYDVVPDLGNAVFTDWNKPELFDRGRPYRDADPELAQQLRAERQADA